MELKADAAPLKKREVMVQRSLINGNRTVTHTVWVDYETTDSMIMALLAR